MTLKSIKLPLTEESQLTFKECKLDRKQYAEILETIISNHVDGFVLSINSEWGTGKTTFIKMFENYLKSKHYTCVYLNAWENDFDDNPLSAIMGELKGILSNSGEQFDKMVEKVSTVAHKVAPILIKGAFNKLTGTNADELIGAIVDSSADVFKNEVDEYLNKKENIQDFKRLLKENVSNVSNGKPLVFFIDELDRCRPNYAVSLLENLKHLFDIDNIVFVLSVDKKHLGECIKGVYGSPNIDSDDYLRRFIDIEYNLPKPDIKSFLNYTLDYYKITELIDKYYYQHSGVLDSIINSLIAIVTKENLSLRKTEKFISQLNLILRSFNLGKDDGIPFQLLIFLTYQNNFNRIYINKILDKNITLEELQNEFLNIFEKYEGMHESLYYTEAQLILLYNNYQLNFDKENSLLDKSIYSVFNKNTILNEYIEQTKRKLYPGLKIDSIINRILLMNNINW